MKWSISPKIGLAVASIAIVSSVASVYLFNGFAHGEWDLPGLQQQVQYLTEKSDNHEARITNLEGKTSTPSDSPTPSPVPVPSVSTQPAVQGASTSITGSTTQVPNPTPTATPVPTPVPVHATTWSIGHVVDTCHNTTFIKYVVIYSDRTVKSFDTLPDVGSAVQIADTYSSLKCNVLN